MNRNKMTARVLEHSNGQKREIAQPRVSIVHHPAAACKHFAAKMALTACAVAFLASIVGLAEDVGAPAVAYMVGSVLIANRVAGVLLAGNREG